MEHSELVKRLTKSGKDIATDLNNDALNFYVLMEMVDDVVYSGNRLDMAKKQAVYNKEKMFSGSFREDGSDIKRKVDVISGKEAHILHMAIGIAGEAAELMEAVQRYIDGDRLDIQNTIEELGDLEFYMEGFRQGLELDRETILQHNIDKLTKRYGEKYSDEAAQIRADKS